MFIIIIIITSGGWGSVCLSTQTGGRWTEDEQILHIHVLELITVEYALKSFKARVSGKHVKISTDNTCAVSYLKNMGGSGSKVCNSVASKIIWKWCQDRNTWLTVAFIPWKLNSDADRQSRKFNDNTEWKLRSKLFTKITTVLGTPEMDLFASRLNCQTKPFVSWHRDTEASFVDAFLLTWSEWLVYIYIYIYIYMPFPPFSIMQRVLN